MIVQWFILVVLIQQAHNACVKNRIELWDPTKCEAGRTFFAKLSSVSDNNYIAQPYLYPWLTELKVTLPDQTKSCTGALINDRYVLVAQDCIFPYIQPDQVTVHVGFFNGYGKDVSEIFQARTLQRKAAHFILHPNFDPGNLQTVANNLALIKLDEPVSYSKTIYPIQLPTIAEQFQDHTETQADNVEWSYFSNFGSGDKKLKENVVTLLSSTQCSTVDGRYSQIVTPEVICSVDSGDGVRPCGEEHGGLLTLSKIRRMYNVTELVGITAWEPSTTTNTCQSTEPRVYVRIDKKLLWIKENTKDGLYCKY